MHFCQGSPTCQVGLPDNVATCPSHTAPELEVEAVYGIVVNATRYKSGKGAAEVSMVYGPLSPFQVAALLRVAADALEEDQGQPTVAIDPDALRRQLHQVHRHVATVWTEKLRTDR